MGVFGIGERNEFAEEQKLIIANPPFQKEKKKILVLGVTQ